jgi:pimeloyl-ACP methyl ester carboxylesterase
MRQVTFALMVALVALAGASCGHVRLDGPGRDDPLAYDGAEVARAGTIAIFVPGALASAHIFDRALGWRQQGYALVWYRLPGMDGLPLDHALTITGAADRIADFARAHPGKRWRLVGYSTGGSVVIEAAARIARDCPACDLKVAAISPAVARGGGLATLANGAFDVAAAALRAPALTRRAVWTEYFRTLLFGRKGLSDPELSARARAIVAQVRRQIVIPDRRLAAAHSRDLRHWRPSAPVPGAAGRLRFFVGLEDPVFATWQTLRLARAAGGAKVIGYPRQGHLLLLTEPRVFADILRFFQADG